MKELVGKVTKIEGGGLKSKPSILKIPEGPNS